MHPEISARVCENIKRVRAAVRAEVIHNYFDNVQESTKDIYPENFLNAAETNFVDDPSSVRALVRRGSKRPEQVMRTRLRQRLA